MLVVGQASYRCSQVNFINPCPFLNHDPVARAGAAKVYAIECSSIVEQARAIIADNGFSDTIEVIRGKMEDITLPTDYVDIIISEWMGYFLLYESMLDTVLYARDKVPSSFPLSNYHSLHSQYLRPETGIMLPDKAVLFLCGIEDQEYRAEKVECLFFSFLILLLTLLLRSIFGTMCMGSTCGSLKTSRSLSRWLILWSHGLF
jgi:hypothetical protein